MTRKNLYRLLLVIVGVFLFSFISLSQEMPKFDVSGKSKSTGGDKGGKSATEPDINAFIPVEKQPVVTKRAMPKYPPLAQSARLEGTVWVKVLVEKTGKPKRAVTIKSDAEVFNESAEDAAMRCTFEPAVMNGMNVDCWVVVTYNFKIK